MLVRSTIATVVFVAFLTINHFFSHPAFMIGIVWSGVWSAGTLIKTIYSLIKPDKMVVWLDKVWGIFQTFVFISFTRLFFRSGSNLDPATANETAWETAKSMVNSIGGQWNLAAIPEILANYRGVFVMFVLGMIIHWLPDRWKRWYRINFAMLPLWIMLPIVVIVVFVLYQFVTADLQPFIYFQF